VRSVAMVKVKCKTLNLNDKIIGLLGESYFTYWPEWNWEVYEDFDSYIKD